MGARAENTIIWLKSSKMYPETHFWTSFFYLPAVQKISLPEDFLCSYSVLDTAFRIDNLRALLRLFACKLESVEDKTEPRDACANNPRFWKGVPGHRF